MRGALAVGRDLPTPPPHLPGPFGFADPEHVRRVLGAAGFADVQLERVDAPMELGKDADDAFSYLSTTGVARGLTQDLDEATRQRALAALHAALAAHATDDGVLADASAWLITGQVR